MSKHIHSMFGSVRMAAFVLALPILATATAAKGVEFDANCAPKLARLEQRLYQKANEGADALRSFMWIRRAIFQLDIYETGTWANEVNAARAACLKTRSQAVAG